MIGGFFFMAGHVLFSFRSVAVMYLALSCLVIGNGFFKPNVSAMVGNLYPEGSHLKDRAFNIFYMGINVGAFLAPIVMEVVAKGRVSCGFRRCGGRDGHLRRHLWFFKRHLEGVDVGTGASAVKGTEPKATLTTVDAPPIKPDEADKAPARVNLIDQISDTQAYRRADVIFLIVIVFWMAFHQNGATWTYWANDNTDWGSSAVVPVIIKILTLGLISGEDVSGVISNAINPAFVILLTFPLVWFWSWLDKKGKSLRRPRRWALACMLVAVAYLVMYQAALSGGDTGKVSPWWLIGAYGVITLGELMLSPMGLSLVSKVAPVRLRGLMMGGWFAATSIGNYLVGTIGVKWTVWSHSKFFIVVAIMSAAVGLILFLILKPLKRAMPGV